MFDTQHVKTWNPKWLSLAAAQMWVVTRDHFLTMMAEAQSGNDQNIALAISVLIAQYEHDTGRQCRRYVSIKYAWPGLRRLIADEKIIAQGRSLRRRGIRTAVLTRFPNKRIPSGEAGVLVIQTGVPGIEPKDALGPDEVYRFTNLQGRYWYDVRLKASHVFSEFPPAGQGRRKPQTHNPSKKISLPAKKMSPSEQKIALAIKADEEAIGPLPPTLRPKERNKRLIDRMLKQGLKPSEIPSERTFREYFNHGPGKAEKSG